MERAEQPSHDAYVYAIRDEESYLQAVDEKQPTPPEPLDPASILCQFCGKSWELVPMLFQAKRRTMDPNTSAIVAVWICNECVGQLGQIPRRRAPGNSRAPLVVGLVLSHPTVRIGLAVPGRPIGPWSRGTGAPEASATKLDRSHPHSRYRSVLGPQGIGKQRSSLDTSGRDR